MMRFSLRICLVAAAVAPLVLSAQGQEVVHALAGTVTAINATAKTIKIETDDGSEGLFKDVSGSGQSFDFDKGVRRESTPAAAFKDSGKRVFVFYYGNGGERTVVALRSLGDGPFEKSTGALVKFDRSRHSVTLKKASGEEETFRIEGDTVAETSTGAATGEKLDATEGEQIRVTSATVNGVKTALFIVPA
jgi:hypothetical protein